VLIKSAWVLCLALPAAMCASAQDRMPPLAAHTLSSAQKQAADALLKTPRGNGALSGPFIPLLRSPELMDRLQRTGEYLRFHNSIGQELTEFVILLTARQWTQQYEFAIHEPLALKAGVQPQVIRAIIDGHRPATMNDREQGAYDFFTELRQNQSVSDTTYARVRREFGEQGVVDMTALIGYYTTLAMIMNVAEAPLPKGTQPPLTVFPSATAP
jgi:4-carboxymuconolactone decarboxylase